MYLCNVKYNQFRLGFELVWPCPFPTTITITPQAPPPRILQVLHSRLVPPQMQHKFYKHVKEMEYDNNED